MAEDTGETTFADVQITVGDMETTFKRMLHFHGITKSRVWEIIPSFTITVNGERYYFKTVKGKYITSMFVFYLLARFGNGDNKIRRDGNVRHFIEKLYPPKMVEEAIKYEEVPAEDTDHFALILLLMQGSVMIESGKKRNSWSNSSAVAKKQLEEIEYYGRPPNFGWPFGCLKNKISQ